VVVRTGMNRSGDTFRRPMLYVQDKRMREEIIVAHYRAAMAFQGIDLPQSIVARDAPHDFTFRDADGSELLLEITSFSDHSNNWVLVEAERKLVEALREAGIENSSIAILPYGMSSRAIAPLVSAVQSVPLIRNADAEWLQRRIQEASASRQPLVFLMPDKKGIRHNFLFNARRPLHELVLAAINAKASKNYPRANEMVLIVDEQSMQHSQIDLNNVWDDLIMACQTSPFREIHLYSGHYSNDDGREAEFDLYPLKSAVDQHVTAVLSRGPCPKRSTVSRH
jgi:hypothetical protein